MATKRFFCVWTGQKYDREYVVRLRNMLARHHDNFRLTCLTDKPIHPERDGLENTTFVRIEHTGLTGWWAKLLLLDPKIRGRGRSVYLDLDTIVLNSTDKLFTIPVNGMGVCANFTRIFQHNSKYPCRFGSCVMVFNDGWGADISAKFQAKRAHLMAVAGSYGDQKVLEMLYPEATLLQDLLPKEFFLHKKRFGFYNEVPKESALAIFAGPEKPHNTKFKWLKERWV